MPKKVAAQTPFAGRWRRSENKQHMANEQHKLKLGKSAAFVKTQLKQLKHAKTD
jgi:hypothetical protein